MLRENITLSTKLCHIGTTSSELFAIFSQESGSQLRVFQAGIKSYLFEHGVAVLRG